MAATAFFAHGSDPRNRRLLLRPARSSPGTGIFVYVAFDIDAYVGSAVGLEASASERIRFTETAIRQECASMRFVDRMNISGVRSSFGSVGVRAATRWPRPPSGCTRTNAYERISHFAAGRCTPLATSSTSRPTMSPGSTSSASCTDSPAHRTPRVHETRGLQLTESGALGVGTDRVTEMIGRFRQADVSSERPW